MTDPRVAMLVFFGQAWPAALMLVGFVVFVRQTYGAWEDQRAWAAPGWIAGPMLLAVAGLGSSLVLLVSVPSVRVEPQVLGTVFSAVLAPVGPALKVAAALLLATAPVAWWRTRAFQEPEALHAAVACVLLSVCLASYAADIELHRALLAHSGALAPDTARIAELYQMVTVSRSAAAASAIVTLLATPLWCAVPALRSSGRELLRWVAPVAVLAVTLHGVALLRTGSLLP